MKCVFFLSFLLSFSLQANFFSEDQNPAVVHHVNVITGSLQLAFQDIVAQGAVPIPLNRNYHSGGALHSRSEEQIQSLLRQGWIMGSGWRLLSHTNLLLIPHEHRRGYKAYVDDVLYEYSHKDEKHLIYLKSRDPYAKASGELSARSNSRNNLLRLDLKKGEATLFLASGGERVYRGEALYKKDVPSLRRCFYLLDVETLPSKHCFCYFYDREKNLERVEARNEARNKVYSSIDFSYTKADLKGLSCLKATTSDNKKIEYFLGCYRNMACIQEVYSNCKGQENFHLKCERKGIGPRVVAFQGGGRERFHVRYYGPSNEQYSKEWTASPSKKPFCVDKVYDISAPLGSSGETITAARFAYSENSTLVEDAEGIQTVYLHDGEKLTHILYYNKERVCSAIQRFFWEESNLRAKAMCDGMGNILFAKSFFYAGGNVIAEALQGQLTGKETTPLLTDAKEGVFGELHVMQATGKEAYIQGNIKGGESYWKKYAYYPNNLLKYETEEEGPSYEYFYKPETDLLSLKLTKDSKGKILTRHFNFYDEDNLLVSEIVDDGSSIKSDDLSDVTQRLEKHMDRNVSGLPEVIQEFYWDFDTSRLKLLRKTKLTYQNQKVVEEAVYDAEGVYRYTIYTAYDKFGNVKSRTNPIGQENTYEYDDIGLLKRSKEVGSSEKVFSYDAVGRLISCLETEYDKVTSTAYDSKGRVLCQVDSRGNTTQYSYDSFGNRISSLFPSVYDQQEEVYQPQLVCEYNIRGDLVSSTNSDGHTTKTSYNSLRKPTCIIQADGKEIRHFYTKNGLLSKTVYPDDTQECYSYDLFQRITQKTVLGTNQEILSEEKFEYNAFQLLSSTDSKGLTTYFYYDGAGRKIREETEGRVTAYTYDSLGFIERVDNPCQSIIQKHNTLGLIEEQWEEDASGVIENRMRFVYDDENHKCEAIRVTTQGDARDFFSYKEGKLVKHTDPKGAVTEFVYDEIVNEIEQKVSRKTTIDPIGNQTIQIYDVGDRLSLIEKKDPSGKTVLKEKYLHDRSGNVAKRISYLKEKEHLVSWKYDAMGRVLEENEAGQKITRFEYDVRGRLAARILPSNVKVFSLYDGLGRLISQTSSDGVIHEEYQYDNGSEPVTILDHVEGVKIEREYNLFGELLLETNSSGLTSRWVYDELGRITSLILPDGSSIKYVHEGSHLRRVERKSREGRVRSRHTYTKFDCNGRVAEEELILGMGVVTTTHDLLERPIKQTSPYLTHSVSYGLSGLVLNKNNTLLGDKDYAYDALNQLTKEGEEKYEFDSLGNPSDCQINDLNQIVSNEEASFLYDSNGNLVEKNTSGNSVSYQFDPRGRLTEIVHPEGKKVRYFYDPLSRLLAKEIQLLKDGSWHKESKVYFIYDRDKEIGIVDENHRILELKVLGLGLKGDIGAAVAIEIQDKSYAPLHDFNGNIIALVSTEGVVETYDMDAFGKETSASYLNPWRFSSKRHEEGLVFFGLRFYDPSLGRWISPDPLGFADGANLYVYVHNAPLNRIDLFGLYGEDPYVPFLDLRIGIPGLLNYQLIPCKLYADGIYVDHIVWCSYWHEIKFTPHEHFRGSFNLFDHPEIVGNENINLVTFRHGINTSYSDFAENCKSITDQLPGGLFIGRYHGTEGTIKDLGYTGKELLHIETAEVVMTTQFFTQCADWLHKANPAVFDSSGALESLGALWVHINHSRGGVIDRRAIEGMPAQQSQILQTQLLITSVAPADPMPRTYALQATSYYSWQDGITGPLGCPERILPLVGQALGGKWGARVGSLASALYFNHNDCDIKFVPCVSKWSERTGYIADHAFLGGTYRGVVSEAIDKYHKEYRFYSGKSR